MAEPNDYKLFSAAVNGDLNYFKSLSSDIYLKKNFVFEVHRLKCCVCIYRFERFHGSAEEMLDRFGGAVMTGMCDHCEGRPLCPESDEKAFDIQEIILDTREGELDMMLSTNNNGDDRDNFLAGINVLHIAVALNDLDLVTFLLDNGFDINSPTRRHTDPPINLAVVNGHASMVELLISRGVAPHIGATAIPDYPVYLAVERNFTEILKLLLDNNFECNTDAATMHGMNPIYDAVTEKKIECIKLLLQAGVDTDVKVEHGMEESLLFYAIRTDTEVAKALIEGGINLNDPIYEDDQTQPFLLAVHQGKSELVKLMLDRGVDPNTWISDHSALHIAGFSKCPVTLKLLLQYGADKNSANCHKYTTLHHTAWGGHVELCQILLDAGAEHDGLTQDKNTPLSLACHGNHKDVIQLFLTTRECNVNNADKDNDTALHYTSYNGNLEATMLLLEHGANPAAENSVRATPLWNAIYSKKRELIHLLVRHCVPVDVSSRGINQHAETNFVVHLYTKERSPLFVACDKILTGVPTLLVLAGLDLSKESWIWTEDVPLSLKRGKSSEEHVEERKICKEIEKLCHNALSLKAISRIALRKCLGRRLLDVAGDFELPCTLVKYLLFEQVL